MAKADTEKLWGDPIARIVQVEDGALVGWLYRWNTGEETVRWIDGPPEGETRVLPLLAPRPNPTR